MTRLALALLLISPATVLAAEAGGGPPSPFAGTIAQSIAALLVFFIVFLVLRAKAWGPILKGLNDREDKIRNDLLSAEKARGEALSMLDSYKKQVANADSEVREKLAAAQKDAEAIAGRLKAQAQTEIEEMKTRATKELDESKRAAMAELRTQAATLSTGIATRILKRNINESDQAELIKSALEELQTSSRR